MRTLDHSGIFDAAGSEVHDSELRLHLKLGVGWGGCFSARFQPQHFDSSLTFP